MATNEQILDSIASFKAEMCKRIDEVEEVAQRNDEAIRGNGALGLKAQVAANTKALARIDKYFVAITMLIIGEFLARVFGLI